MISSLWGEEFEISNNDASILNKIKSPKEVMTKSNSAKHETLEEKLEHINQEVTRILGQHKDDTLVIKNTQELSLYIDNAIKDGFIAIDTETNNSLDALTCKIMGACLYSPSQKQCYIPVNHIDIHTNQRLAWQVTEADLEREFNRLVANNVKMIFHNAAFDLRVIQCTCNVKLPVYWDTTIGCKVLNNLEEASLKTQYILHIDKNHGKYSIENLFEKQKYEIIDPDLFALYAATDSMMTYKLYEYQLKEFSKEENSKLFGLFKEVEMPLIPVVKDMVLRGLSIDMDYWKRLKAKYDKQLSDIDDAINKELESYTDRINTWRLTEDANITESKTSDTGKVSVSKSKSEQLKMPINMASSTQLAILLYDVLQVPVVNKKKPRSTDEEALKLIYNKTKLPLCKLLLDRRGYVKLLTTYIDNIPILINHWPDHKARTGYNQYGTDTGRFSSGGKIKFFDKDSDKREEISLINLQTIPSHNKEIRMMFCGSEENRDIECDNNCYIINDWEEVQVSSNNWRLAKELKVGDLIFTSTNSYDKIIDITNKNNKIYLHVQGGD